MFAKAILLYQLLHGNSWLSIWHHWTFNFHRVVQQVHNFASQAKWKSLLSLLCIN